MHISKFDSVNGVPDEKQVTEWTEAFFANTLSVLNSFFAHVSVAEAVERMEYVPFDQLVTEALEGESEAVLKIAVEVIKEKAEMELEFMRAYLE